MDLNFVRHLVQASLFLAGLAVGPAWGQFAGVPGSLAPLVRSVAPSVVGIAVTEAADSAKGAKSAGTITEAAGSGFIVRRDGMIVTNDHVIAGAQGIAVTLNDGERYAARLVGADDLTDIAVIKITSPSRLTPARWGNSAKCQVGDWVLAAGNPFALGNSFTLGIVSAEGRDIGDGPFDHFLQLDAPINPGNSGGPAFDMAGEIIGINSAIVSPSGGSVGIGFAIPSNSARPIVAALIADGGIARGWLGVAVADAPTAADGAAGGAEITGVEAGSPAAQAGLEITDIVTTVDGTPVAGATGLTKAIASMTPGAKVVLGVSKNQHISYLPVIVDRRPAQLGE
jgi:serine protease Do